VARYFDPSGPYAADTFNTMGVNEPDAIGADDLLAVHLLDIDIDPRTVRAILDDEALRGFIAEKLGSISSDIAIWHKGAERCHDVAEELWKELTDVPGVGAIIAGKILARKRPRLIPIYDKRIRRYLDPPAGRFWETLRLALRQDNLPAKIEEALRPDFLQGDVIESQVTTIRLLDVAIWMRQSIED
jgi:hypothetical protein